MERFIWFNYLTFNQFPRNDKKPVIASHEVAWQSRKRLLRLRIWITSVIPFPCNDEFPPQKEKTTEGGLKINYREKLCVEFLFNNVMRIIYMFCQHYLLRLILVFPFQSLSHYALTQELPNQYQILHLCYWFFAYQIRILLQLFSNQLHL